MSDRVEKVKAGIFVLVSIVLLAAVLVLVAGLRVFKSSKTYYVRFAESVTGLEESSIVRYQGVPVGRVANIGFASGDVNVIEVTIEVEPEFPLREGTDAKLRPQGITGIYYIDLSGGRPGGEPLGEEAVICASEKSLPVQIEEALSDLGSVVKRVDRFFELNQEQISALVADARETVQAGRTSFANLDRALQDATELTGSLRQKLERMADTAQSTLEAAEAFVGNPVTQGVPGKVDAFLDRANRIAVEAEARVVRLDLDGLVSRVERALLAMEEIAEATRGVIAETKAGVAENRGALTRSLANFEGFSQELKAFMKEVRRDPPRLLFSRQRQGRRVGP